jgi:hypothetical protein
MEFRRHGIPYVVFSSVYVFRMPYRINDNSSELQYTEFRLAEFVAILIKKIRKILSM